MGEKTTAPEQMFRPKMSKHHQLIDSNRPDNRIWYSETVRDPVRTTHALSDCVRGWKIYLSAERHNLARGCVGVLLQFFFFHL